VEAMWKGDRVLQADKEISRLLLGADSLGAYSQSGSDMPR